MRGVRRRGWRIWGRVPVVGLALLLAWAGPAAADGGGPGRAAAPRTP